MKAWWAKQTQAAFLSQPQPSSSFLARHGSSAGSWLGLHPALGALPALQTGECSLERLDHTPTFLSHQVAQSHQLLVPGA